MQGALGPVLHGAVNAPSCILAKTGFNKRSVRLETNSRDVNALLRQLGLAPDVDAFVAAHRLPAGVPLAKAPFWSPAQAAFLEQAIVEDADWAQAVDALATRLS